MRIALVAGEASGDLLGAGLIRAIRRSHPDAKFEGMAGPAMRAEGCAAWWPHDAIAVMGIFEVLAQLPRLLALRREIVARLLADPPDVFIGIDSPDFTLASKCFFHVAATRSRAVCSGLPSMAANNSIAVLPP